MRLVVASFTKAANESASDRGMDEGFSGSKQGGRRVKCTHLQQLGSKRTEEFEEEEEEEEEEGSREEETKKEKQLGEEINRTSS